MSLYLGSNLLAGSFKTGASWEVGDIGQSALGIDESLNKRRYLNGQVISQTQFAQFTAWLKQRVSVYPSLATSEADWQTAVTNSDLGQCGQFVIDDVNSTIRLPKVVNLQGLQDLTHLGETVEAGLPNIEGEYGFGTDINTTSSGAAKMSLNTGSGRYISSGGTGFYEAGIDTSGGNSIYGNSTTVQPESVQYPYFIQVAEGIENSVDVIREIELSNPFSLLDYKFSEYEITNASWLRSNGQYNSGTTYVDVYNLLLQIYNGTVAKAGVSVKLSTETYADTDFVLNTSDTTFRLPLKVALASGKAVAGNGMTLGLTNGTDNYGLIFNNNQVAMGKADGYNKSIGTLASGATSASGTITYGITLDSTKSGIETSADGLYLYFYVGAVVQDASVIAAASVLTDVANLKNGIGFSNTGKEAIVGWGMPDYSAGVTKANNIDYVAEIDGFLVATTSDYNGGQSVLYVNNEAYHITGTNSGIYQLDASTITMPIPKGTSYKVVFGRIVNTTKCIFYPLKGVN